MLLYKDKKLKNKIADKPLWDKLKILADAMMSTNKEIVNDVKNYDYDAAGEKIKKMADEGVESTKTTIGTLKESKLDPLVDKAVAKGKEIKEKADDLAQKAEAELDHLKNEWSSIKDKGESLLAQAKSKADKIIDKIEDSIW